MNHSGRAADESKPWLDVVRPLVGPALLAITANGLAGGGIAWLARSYQVADGFWIGATLVAVIPALVWLIAALRHGRAKHDLTALLAHAPRSARRRVGDRVAVVPLADVEAGDVVVVGPGEVVPVDGRIEAAVAVLDKSALARDL